MLTEAENLLQRTLGKIRRILTRGREAGIDRLRQEEPMFVEGVAEDITFETLNELCLHYLGERLKHVSHVHLSSWKRTGSYRLLLETQGGRHWSLIYKNAVYGPDQLPALIGLPITPGPPEFVVYNNVQGALAKYLPAVYLCLEVVPGKHYQYLLEDMCSEYQRPGKPEAILSITAELPSVHSAISEWSLAVSQENPLQYGHRFSVALQQYVQENLECYVRKATDKAVSEVYQLWPQISKVHGCKEYHELQNIRQIHGDFGASNIFIHKKYPHRIKLIDWEWAGMGIAHADLASLLKGATTEIEQYALVLFSRKDKNLSLDEHRRLYHWCQLERGLLDASYVAAQYMKTSTMTRLNLPGFIRKAMQRVLRAYQELV